MVCPKHCVLEWWNDVEIKALTALREEVQGISFSTALILKWLCLSSELKQSLRLQTLTELMLLDGVLCKIFYACTLHYEP